MDRLTIICESCERLWSVGCSLTIYERQTMESRPCPHCGAYTLSCQDFNAVAGTARPQVYWSTFAA